MTGVTLLQEDLQSLFNFSSCLFRMSIFTAFQPFFQAHCDWGFFATLPADHGSASAFPVGSTKLCVLWKMTLQSPMGRRVTALEYFPLLPPQDNTIFVMTKLYNKKSSSNFRSFCWPVLVKGPARSPKFKCCSAAAKLLSRCCPERATLPHVSLSLFSLRKCS